MDNSPSIPDLLQQIKSKEEEISSLSRKLREVENTLSAKESETKIEIESLKQENKNKDELINDYKTQLQNRKNPQFEVDKNQVLTLENKITDLENKLLLAEQNEQNAKRQILNFAASRTDTINSTDISQALLSLSIRQKKFVQNNWF